MGGRISKPLPCNKKPYVTGFFNWLFFQKMMNKLYDKYNYNDKYISSMVINHIFGYDRLKANRRVSVIYKGKMLHCNING